MLTRPGKGEAEARCYEAEASDVARVIKTLHWIGLSSVLRPHQHSIGYMGDGFYRSKDPTNSIKVMKEKATKENNPENKENTKYTYACTHTK